MTFESEMPEKNCNSVASKMRFMSAKIYTKKIPSATALHTYEILTKLYKSSCLLSIHYSFLFSA